MLPRRRSLAEISSSDSPTGSGIRPNKTVKTRRGNDISVSPTLVLLLLACAMSLFVPTASAQLRGVPPQQRSAAQRRSIRQKQNQELCTSSVQPTCGSNAEGWLVCEYSEVSQTYATRCVKQSAAVKHVGYHHKNYCGACHKCFKDSQELQTAVDEYLNAGDDASSSQVAQVYGFPMNTWCVDYVTDFSYLFQQRNNFNTDISFWDVSRATSMKAMFMEASTFDQDLSLWNVSNVRDFSSMFDRAYGFTGGSNGLGDWDTSSATDMSRMFRIAKHFRGDGLEQWNTASVTSMSRMFYRTQDFNAPLRTWNVAAVQDFSFMFAYSQQFNQDLSSWTTTSATSMRGLFQHAEAFVQDLTSWHVGTVTDMAFMFENAISFQQPQEPNCLNMSQELLDTWDLEKVKDRTKMFGSRHSVQVV